MLTPAPKPQCRLGASTQKSQNTSLLLPDILHMSWQGKSHGGTARYYRDSLNGLQRAVHGWQDRGVDFGMHLGDLVDG